MEKFRCGNCTHVSIEYYNDMRTFPKHQLLQYHYHNDHTYTQFILFLFLGLSSSGSSLEVNSIMIYASDVNSYVPMFLPLLNQKE